MKKIRLLAVIVFLTGCNAIKDQSILNEEAFRQTSKLAVISGECDLAGLSEKEQKKIAVIRESGIDNMVEVLGKSKKWDLVVEGKMGGIKCPAYKNTFGMYKADFAVSDAQTAAKVRDEYGVDSYLVVWIADYSEGDKIVTDITSGKKEKYECREVLYLTQLCSTEDGKELWHKIEMYEEKGPARKMPFKTKFIRSQEELTADKFSKYIAGDIIKCWK